MPLRREILACLFEMVLSKICRLFSCDLPIVNGLDGEMGNISGL